MPAPQLDRDAIAARAFALYVRRGRQPGHSMDDWLEAERQLRAEMAAPAADAPGARGSLAGQPVPPKALPEAKVPSALPAPAPIAALPAPAAARVPAPVPPPLAAKAAPAPAAKPAPAPAAKPVPAPAAKPAASLAPTKPAGSKPSGGKKGKRK
jgi:hypothetical protein